MVFRPSSSHSGPHCKQNNFLLKITNVDIDREHQSLSALMISSAIYASVTFQQQQRRMSMKEKKKCSK